MESSTDAPLNQALPPADPSPHEAAALCPLMDVDSAEFGELVDDRWTAEARGPALLEHGVASL